jgi:hypothetical protein
MALTFDSASAIVRMSFADDGLLAGGSLDAGTGIGVPALVDWPEDARTVALAGLGAALAAAGSAHTATQTITTGQQRIRPRVSGGGRNGRVEHLQADDR